VTALHAVTASNSPNPADLRQPGSEGPGYWIESRQPLAALIFVAPLLLIYEAGVVFFGPTAVRNGADAWLRWLLEALGFGQYFLLPILTVCILLAWHHTTGNPWRCRRGVLSGMLVESVVLGFCVRLILQIQGMLLLEVPGDSLAMSCSLGAQLRAAVGFLGAGIYEELLFRLILLSLAVLALRWAAGPRFWVVPVAVVVTSLLFSAAHYVGPHGEPLLWADGMFWFRALFRFVAGAFFAVLFLCRGFGIAVGAHAFYDLLVGLF